MKPQYIEINNYGTKSYFSNKKMTKYHREDGPAIDSPEPFTSWFFNNELHRVGGPAIEYADGVKKWFIKGIEYTEEQYHKCFDKEV